MIYRFADIIHIGEAGLEFIDEFQDIRFISFETCGRNAVRVLGSQVQPACVGRHQFVIEMDGRILRQIEFFTTEPTVFEVASDVEFRRLRFRVEQLGWKLV